MDRALDEIVAERQVRPSNALTSHSALRANLDRAPANIPQRGSVRPRGERRGGPRFGRSERNDYPRDGVRKVRSSRPKGKRT